MNACPGSYFEGNKIKQGIEKILHNFLTGITHNFLPNKYISVLKKHSEFSYSTKRYIYIYILFEKQVELQLIF